MTNELHWGCNGIYNKVGQKKAVKNNNGKTTTMLLYKNIIIQFDCPKMLVSVVPFFGQKI
jgi:hypothetical protein